MTKSKLHEIVKVKNKTGKVQVNNTTIINMNEPNKSVKVEGERDLSKMIKDDIEMRLKFLVEDQGANNDLKVDVAKDIVNQVFNLHSHLLSTLGRRVREEVIAGDYFYYKSYVPKTNEALKAKNELKKEQRQRLSALLSSMEEKL